MLEAKLKLSMGGAPSNRDTHSVAEVVASYISDGVTRLSPGSIDFYRKGEAALPPAFATRAIATVTPLVLDNAYGEMRAGGASEHKVQKVHRLCRHRSTVRSGTGGSQQTRASRRTTPKTSSPEIEPPTPSQVRDVIADAERVNADLAVCLRLAAATGARRGELVALKWVDFQGCPADDSSFARGVRRPAARTADEDRHKRSQDDRRRRCDACRRRRAQGASRGGSRRARPADARVRVLVRRRRFAVATGVPDARVRTAV